MVTVGEVRGLAVHPLAEVFVTAGDDKVSWPAFPCPVQRACSWARRAQGPKGLKGPRAQPKGSKGLLTK